MTSPVSAIEAIEKAMEGVTHPDAPEWIAVAQDGDGPNGGFWTCAAATTESPRYIRADIYSALARQAEALQRENAEKDAEISKLLDFVGKAQGVAMGVAMSGRAHPNPDGALMGIFNDGQELIEAIRARALLGGSENAE